VGSMPEHGYRRSVLRQWSRIPAERKPSRIRTLDETSDSAPYNHRGISTGFPRLVSSAKIFIIIRISRFASPLFHSE
jgi:hypothetical protein